MERRSPAANRDTRGEPWKWGRQDPAGNPCWPNFSTDRKSFAASSTLGTRRSTSLRSECRRFRRLELSLSPPTAAEPHHGRSYRRRPLSRGVHKQPSSCERNPSLSFRGYLDQDPQLLRPGKPCPRQLGHQICDLALRIDTCAAPPRSTRVLTRHY